ncbi:MAG: Asp-tRNA(Asn)/Glu-tRNA(Gln) amidotransferase subunit GatC [Ignavibacteriales bacterium]|nr:Asp-tRNA(Asn)/Glu-tRNA(Gln) amidotransferase subunit GatC [Ignavibacteriales bacterium]
MAVTLKDVEYIAKLARLKFTEEEKQKLAHQLNEILSYIDQLNKIDTSKVEPMTHVVDLSNVFREDVVKPGVSSDEALKNAPAKSDKFFKVPKVIGEKNK